MNSLIAIVGPTAAGKTEVSLKLAQQVNGEIINADSRQVYRHMDIGTAKPIAAERTQVPHHLFDFIDPDEDFSLALYQDKANEAIIDIHNRGKVPVLVGGSGQYVWAILEGWSVPEVPPSPEIREELESRAKAEGGDVLYWDLQEVDPEAANQIDPRNIRRVIRALEVCRVTGKRFSELRIKTPPDFNTQIVGITAQRDELYRRIDERVDRMIERGFVEEVRGLLARGFPLSLPSMSSLGYQEIGRYLNGELDLPEASQQIKYTTHRFARRQYTWFRLNDERIRWFDLNEASLSEVILEGICYE